MGRGIIARLKACVTLDLEPDFAGRLAPVYGAWDPARVGAMLDLLAAHGASLSAFVVGSSLGAVPAVLERLRAAGTEFHLHSYSHDLARPDTADEIERGQEAFARFFGRPAEGYRAPEGRISDDGLARLDALGFRFDSSVFPSLLPRPRYGAYPRTPYRPAGLRLVEMPVATVSPARIVVSLSWMKLLGWPAFRRLLDLPLPEPLVFDMHLHDLWPLASRAGLRPPWSWVYARNEDAGLRVLDDFLGTLRAKGYTFSTIGTAAAEAAAALPARGAASASAPAVRAS
jgi:peptidoglycan/xylan/chitin deacetylase (PgdA/CDA1 family)